MRFGFHVSIADGWLKTVQRAVDRRCTALQVFTSAPVQWERKPLNADGARWFGETLRALDIRPLFVHAVYLLNLASPDRSLWRKSRDHLTEELGRAALLGASGVVIHLGSVGRRGSSETGARRVARALDWAASHADGTADIVLENCAGQGNLVGCTPDQLGCVIRQAAHADRLKVCIDTAHAFAYGHTIHTPDGLDLFLGQCDEAFGLDRLSLIHANDSKTPLGSNVDRHGHIGKGHIGHAGFRVIMKHCALSHLPFIMETPAQQEWHSKDMRALRMAVDRQIRPALPPRRVVPPPE